MVAATPAAGRRACSALQTAAISAGLPFAVVLLVMCYSIYKGLSYEHGVIIEGKRLEYAEGKKLERVEGSDEALVR